MYSILGALLLVSVVPMYFYADRVVRSNQERLETNEKLLQYTVTRSVVDELTQRQITLRMMLDNLASSIAISSGSNLNGEHVSSPELRAILEQFVASSSDLAYATLLNADAHGIRAGKIEPDSFMQREFERAFAASREGRPYNGQPLMIADGKRNRTVMVICNPLQSGDRFYGMIGIVLDLQFLIDRLEQASKGGLNTYVVDHEGRLVAGALPTFVTGQDMKRFEIVRKFLEQEHSHVRVSETREFRYEDHNQTTDMLGTYNPVPAFDWAVIAQKDKHDAYASVSEMRNYSRWLEILAVLLSIGISYLAARRITEPLELLTESSRAIARGDFSQRVNLKNRTEIGELAETFNTMSADLERFVRDLKRAADENRALFLNSIQMLAGAVDEKDPYTRGHSDRVTKISVLLATEMGLPESEIDKIRIAALLHDVGKIGIEDAVLKKPGALTHEEYEIMKTHTVKGANILRPVSQLTDMLPGIELHHESLDGRGYPYGLVGDRIPLMARIISVADTFDAMTTNRPYQSAMQVEYVVKRIRSLVGPKFDGLVVAALESVVAKGLIRVRRVPAPAAVEEAKGAAAAANTTIPALDQPS
jgi:putative nucleotidyltransferase with HDIG domain